MIRPVTSLLGWLGIAAIGIALAIAVYFTLVDAKNPIRLRLNLYQDNIDKELRFLFIQTPAARIVNGMVVGTAGLVLAMLLFDELLYGVAAIAALWFLPPIYLKQKHRERVDQIEQMLDGWMLLLSNALKAAPSLGEALENSAKLIRPPFNQEVDLVLKEMRLGTPIDQALLGMAKRIDSRVVGSALATLLVGRQTGGDLPGILESAASTLREMQRLEGVVRTKTAENRAQAVVMALIPFVVSGAIAWLDPNWKNTLFYTFGGNLILGVAGVIWLGSIIWIQKILAVDI